LLVPSALAIIREWRPIRIWANITQIAPDRFFVTVSAVPKEERTQERTGGVKTAEAKTLDEATRAARPARAAGGWKELRRAGT
jgi:hypothetical protein